MPEITRCVWCDQVIGDTRLGLVVQDSKGRSFHAACASNVLGMVNLTESEWRLIETRPAVKRA